MKAEHYSFYNYYEDHKVKKVGFFAASGYYFNHPHRLPAIKLTGDLTHDFDQRASATGLSALRTLKEIDFSLLPSWEREFSDKFPSAQAPGTWPTTSAFLIYQDVHAPWRMEAEFGPEPSTVIVGTSTDYVYTRDTISAPWVEFSATPSDILLAWTPAISGGGIPASGGKGADTDANSVAISLADISWFPSCTVYRLPWQEPWASESAILSDAFDALLLSQGSDYSGTTTATLEFTI